MSLVAIFDGKRYGYADARGAVVIAPRFTKIPGWGFERFREGRVPAWEGARWGMLDETGEWAVEPRWDYAHPYVNGLARVARLRQKRLRWWLVDLEGRERGPASGWFKLSDVRDDRGFAEDEPGSGTYLIDGEGQRVGDHLFAGSNNPQDGSAHAYGLCEGLALVHDASTRLWGYVDREGEWVIPPRYASAASFSEGLACVRSADNDVGFVDRAGAERFRYPLKYLTLSSFSEGMALVPDADDSFARAYYDPEGRVRIPARREHARGFHDGRALYRMSSGRCGFIDAEGTVVIEPTLASAQDFCEGLAIAVPDPRKPRRFGYVDRAGVLVIPP